MPACPACTLYNPDGATMCSMCGTGLAPPTVDLTGGGAAAGAEPEDDPDLAFARALQAELNGPATYACEICGKMLPIEGLYVLDACSHRFCRPCLGDYVKASLSEKLSDEVTCPKCDAPMSIRDIQDFTRPAAGSGVRAPARSTPAAPVPTGSVLANRRLLKEFSAISKQDPAALKFTTALVNDSLYEWEVKMVFDADDPAEGALGGDLRRVAGNSITLRIVFQSSYPQTPPYIRVIRPRFQFRTGHVTVGGSICVETLTQSGWDPSMTVESVLLTVRTNMVIGGGRIDFGNTSDYSRREADEAFARLKRVHGWL